MNKLVNGNLVRGLPSKPFENDQTCVACQKIKQHSASCKSKIENSISLPLHLLHMDLFGPTFVKSLMKKMYCLVVTYDYSRFTWVFFLATKDETSGILKSVIIRIENLVDHNVKVIRCDNETEFKNREMNQFYEMNGILRQFSVARTPQQDRVAKRRNMTLIEAAKTMLANSKLLRQHEGFFVGYSLKSKSFRVFNSRTRIVKENLHIRFSESTPNIVGTQFNGFADSKSSHDDGSKPSCNDGKKVDEDPRKEIECKDQKKKDNVNNNNNVNIARNVNTVSSTVNVAGTNEDNELSFNPNMPALEDVSIFNFSGDDENDGTKWVFKNKKDEMGIVLRNKARLVTQWFTNIKTASTPIETQKPLLKDEDGKEVDVHMYRSMIGSLMYLTSLRPDIMFVVCAYARYQVNPKVLHLHAVKSILRYLKGPPKLSIWYPKDSPFDLVAYTDSDYARVCSTAMAKTINEEVHIHARVDGKEIVITESSVRRDLQLSDEEGEGLAIPTDPHHTPTILQPSSSQPQKTQKHRNPKRKDTQVPQPSGPTNNVIDKVVYKELGNSLVRAATTAFSLKVEQDSGSELGSELTSLAGSELASELTSLADIEYTGDTNMISYDQYVKDNAEPVVRNNASFVSNDASMIIINEMPELTPRYSLKFVQARCLELESKLSKLKDKIQKDDHDAMENKEVHLEYLKHLKESVATIREIAEKAKVERPLDSSLVFACLYTKRSQELVEYVVGTCPKDFNKRDKKHATTPLTRKKQVTFADQCETSNNNTHKHVEQQTTQKTYVPMIPSTGVKNCTDASRSKPRSNTKKNRISPVTSVNRKTVEDHPRTN
nr:putative ribonuclease H-like domain-containing protein [Tanacetum cinerariifolium]